MGSVPMYSKVPTDWTRIDDVGVELRRVAGIGLIAGCMRLWVWVMYRGVRDSDGALLCDWNVAGVELGVSVKQVYRWRRELEYCGWMKRRGTGAIWIHPSMDMVRRCLIDSNNCAEEARIL